MPCSLLRISQKWVKGPLWDFCVVLEASRHYIFADLNFKLMLATVLLLSVSLIEENVLWCQILSNQKCQKKIPQSSSVKQLQQFSGLYGQPRETGKVSLHIISLHIASLCLDIEPAVYVHGNAAALNEKSLYMLSVIWYLCWNSHLYSLDPLSSNM